MSVGEPQKLQWCYICGGFFPTDKQHAHISQHNFAPYPADRPVGAQVVPVLTEADVRRIVREELRAAVGVPASEPAQPKGGA